MVKSMSFCAALIAAALFAPAIHAQQGEPVKRTMLQNGDFPGSAMATQLMLIEIIPNGLVPRHTHPGGEVGYILDGEVEFTIGNAPPKTAKCSTALRATATSWAATIVAATSTKRMITMRAEISDSTATPNRSMEGSRLNVHRS